MSRNLLHAIQVSTLPDYFARFPVMIHHQSAEIQQATIEVADTLAPVGSKVHHSATFKHSGAPEGQANLYALTMATGDLEKIKLTMEIVEIMWCHDNEVEDDTVENAASSALRYRRALYADFNDEASTASPPVLARSRIQHFKSVCHRIHSADPEFWVSLRSATDEWLQCEEKAFGWQTLDQYLQFRKDLVAHKITGALACWAAGIKLTENETVEVAELNEAIAIWLGTVNDYMSWNVERARGRDRVVNCVHLIMEIYNLPETEAVHLSRGLMVAQEERIHSIMGKLRQVHRDSGSICDFVDLMSHYAGGWFYWSMVSPRYRVSQTA